MTGSSSGILAAAGPKRGFIREDYFFRLMKAIKASRASAERKRFLMYPGNHGLRLRLHQAAGELQRLRRAAGDLFGES
jgi:hypothetical protein